MRKDCGDAAETLRKDYGSSNNAEIPRKQCGKIAEMLRKRCGKTMGVGYPKGLKLFASSTAPGSA